MKKLNDIVLKSLENKLPFVVYRKPNAEIITGVFQNDNTTTNTLNLDIDGFIFAPFDNKQEALIIPYSNSNIQEFKIKTINVELAINSKSSSISRAKNTHIKLVEKGIDAINNSDLNKVVLSRKEEVSIDDFQIVETFKRLCDNYPNAFVYLWFHPKSGLWMGATPERLLAVKDNKFKVMALASTQEYKGSLNVKWGLKEQEEHQFVVDFIVSNLKGFELEISKTYTIKAGNLLHLRADISGSVPSKIKNVTSLINILHPTPAICGLPKEKAKAFILENENYNREYYTGFLGEMNGNSIDLFVNLRCMKVDLENKQATIFIGGGITKDSDSEKEWNETVAKANVMKKVL